MQGTKNVDRWRNMAGLAVALHTEGTEVGSSCRSFSAGFQFAAMSREGGAKSSFHSGLNAKKNVCAGCVRSLLPTRPRNCPFSNWPITAHSVISGQSAARLKECFKISYVVKCTE